MIQPTPTILAWLHKYEGPTPNGKPLWWAHTTWDGDERHFTVVEQAPPEGWEIPTEWVPDPTWPGAYIPRRLSEDRDDG